MKAKLGDQLPPQAAPQAQAAPPMSGQMPAQPNAPVTLRSLGYQAPAMGGGGVAPWQQAGFKPPEHAWKPKPAPQAAPQSRQALARALTDKEIGFLRDDMRRYESDMAGIGAP